VSVLPDHAIRALRPGRGAALSIGGYDWSRRVLEPWSERAVQNGMSYGLSCAGYDVRCRQRLVLAPGGFLLASTVEHFWMPNDVLGRVADKSTWARRGLAVQNTVIECSWRGWLTLELTNHSKKTIVIQQGDPIAQILFERLESPPERGYDGKYLDQPDYPVEAIYER
jgi:dCTP deaminase